MTTITQTVNGISNSRSRWAALALAGVTYFALAIVALHFLRPDLSPVAQPTSAYAVGKFGFIMTTAFFSMSLASASLLLALRQGLPSEAHSRFGLGLLAVWTVGVLVAMLFPLDPEDASPTLAGTIHQTLAPFTFLSLVSGSLLVSRRFRQAAGWQTLYWPAFTLSTLMLVGFVATAVSLSTDSGVGGLAQRILLITFLAWFYLVALRLRVVAGPNR